MFKGLLSRSPIDGFILAILAAVVLAAVFPAEGRVADILDWVVIAAIALLFFLYGARLHPKEALAGLAHWRLHLTILAFTFVAFPLVGFAIRPITEPIIGHDLYLGILFLCLVPSTVQSSIAFTSMARGNVAGAIVSASASNIIGVVLTPLLVIALMSSSSDEVHISGGSIVKIMLQILLPFIVGQLARPLVTPFLKRFAEPTRYVDRGSIVLVVFVAFSEGVRNGIWSIVGPWQVVAVSVISIVLVVIMLLLTGWLPKKMGFDRADTIAIQFCGTKKSLATGLPMATVLFGGTTVGLIVLPLMIFHQVQLIMCSWLATRYGKQADEAGTASS